VPDDSTPTTYLDDLDFDYAVSQILEGISISEHRGALPSWVGEYAHLLIQTLETDIMPPHVKEAANSVANSDGYDYAQIYEALHHVEQADAEYSYRSLRTFLTRWRETVKANRPRPRFTPGVH
jgi:hypothetical protein